MTRLFVRLLALPVALALLALLLVAGAVMLASRVVFITLALAIEAVTSV